MFFPIIMKDEYKDKPISVDSFRITHPSKNDSSKGQGVLELPKIKHLLNHSIAVYGGSKCGKTTVVNNLVHGLVSCMDEVYVFSGSEKTNLNYSRCLPAAPFITHELTNDALEAIMEKQEAKDSFYYNIHDFVQVKSILEEYSERIYDSFESSHHTEEDLDEREKHSSTVKGVKTRFKRYLELPKYELLKIASSAKIGQGMDMTIRDYVIRYIKADPRISEEEYILYLYITPVIKWIRRHVDYEVESTNYNESDSINMFKVIVLFWELRRNTLIIIDDLTEQIQSLASSKKGNSCINTIMTAGRHKKITLIMIMHNPSVLNVTTRLSIMVSMFCDNDSAKGFFHNDSEKKNELLGYRYAMGGKMFDEDNDFKLVKTAPTNSTFRCIPIRFSDGGLSDKNDSYNRFMYIRSYIIKAEDILAITKNRFDYMFTISKQLEAKQTEAAMKKALKVV